MDVSMITCARTGHFRTIVQRKITMDIGQHCSVDDNVWNNTKLLRLGIEMAHGNEFAACFQGISRPSNSLQSYEYSLIEGEVLQDVPSDYANGITRDVCFD